MLNTVNKKISLILAILSMGYLVLAFLLPDYPYVPVDSDAVPITLGFILLFLSIFLFFEKDNHSQKQAKIPKGEKLVLLTVLGFIILFIIFLEILGFIITTAVFIYVNSWFLGYKKWRSNLIVSLAIPIVIYFLFSSFLQIQLPRGVLPF
ncbi:tripartite tricarboxylate transporter TctB family protein [Caldifermentibacillus hisashii]|uniref:tripartite tricarboxylate transporter TctB family protein n=1 Tax=Caldifermentibacillus hisashii TaxID=996558 RepID=UPI0031FE191B